MTLENPKGQPLWVENKLIEAVQYDDIIGWVLYLTNGHVYELSEKSGKALIAKLEEYEKS